MSTVQQNSSSFVIGSFLSNIFSFIPLYISYKIGDIVDTLVDYCAREELDPKRTYFWICFLCVNQHRVVETSNEKSLSVPTETFLATFGKRVSRIGRIVCMMAPFEKPVYLSRVWCIFEMATAFANPGCSVTVMMPPEEKKSWLHFSPETKVVC